MTANDVREWHYLRKLTSTKLPTSLMIVDTEAYVITDPNNSNRELHKLRLYCYHAMRYEQGNISREVYGHGDTQEQFWNDVKERIDRKRPLWIFTHNAGYDMTVLGLWKRIITGEFELVQIDEKHPVTKDGRPNYKWVGVGVLDDPPTIIKLRYAGSSYTVIVVDTMNYFRDSLDSIGKSIGSPKYIMPEQNEDIEEWKEYCMRDVYILSRAVISLIKLVQFQELGKFGYTISSIAMNAYRSRFIPDDIQILIHGNKDVLDIEREAMHGGACQCWYKGCVIKEGEVVREEIEDLSTKHFVNGPVYITDVKSFYPSIMRDNLFPYRLCGKLDDIPYNDLVQMQDEFAMIGRFQLYCEEPGFPVTRNGKTFYAKGKIYTTLCGPEIQRAINEDCIASAGDICIYAKTNLFCDFVDYFWDLRKTFEKMENYSFAYVCKLIMNSLYGKFAQRQSRWTEADDVFAPIPLGHWWEKHIDSDTREVYRSLGYLPQKQSGRREHDHSFPAIAAYVTSYGRERILRLARIAGIDNCFYSDTDSLHVDSAGILNLGAAYELEDDTLGRLMLRQVVHSAEYRGPKNYTIDGFDVIAGVKNKAEKVRRNQYKQRKFQRIASILAGKELDSVAVDYVEMTLKEWYPMGSISYNGRIEAPILSEW